MRRTRTMLVLWLCMCPLYIQAQPGVSGSYMLSSKYVSRGVNTVNNWVYQQSTSVQLDNWTTSLWGNMDLTNHNGFMARSPHGST